MSNRFCQLLGVLCLFDKFLYNVLYVKGFNAQYVTSFQTIDAACQCGFSNVGQIIMLCIKLFIEIEIKCLFYFVTNCLNSALLYLREKQCEDCSDYNITNQPKPKADRSKCGYCALPWFLRASSQFQ